MAKGKGKGSSFERDLCRELSLWWTKGKSDSVFWRTSISGGRATVRSKKGKTTYGQYGDIQAVDPQGHALMRLVTIEAKKGYNGETLANALDRIPKKGEPKGQCSMWEKFIKQARTESKAAGTPYWFLIHKRDHRATMIFMPYELGVSFRELWKHGRPRVVVNVGGHAVYGIPLTVFKAHVGRDRVEELEKTEASHRRIVVRIPT